MKNFIKAISFFLCVFLFGGLTAAMLTAHYFHKHEPVPQIDTIIVHDTFCYEKPVPIYTRTIDSIRVTIVDTLRQTDTIVISLPREEKVYKDSTYRAVVSGYLPSLDTIEVYRQNMTITETIVREVPIRKRWGIGIQAGYGATVNDKHLETFPYLGIGISYNLIRF